MNELDPNVQDATYQDALKILELLSQVGSKPAPLPAQTPRAEAIPPSTNGLARAAEGVPPLSELSLRPLVESLPDAVVVINARGHIALVNHQTELMFGYTRPELLGYPIEILIPERFRVTHIQQRERYFTHPQARPMGIGLELHGRRKDGSEFPVEISLSPLTTEDGLFATSVIRDLSQRKRAEAKFRTLVENIPAVTFIAPLDKNLPELYVSPQIEALLGFTQQEWLADPILWHRQLHPEDRERWNHQFAPTCSDGRPFRSVYRFIAKNGRVVWVHGAANLVRDEEGNLLFLQGIAFDVTAIKEAEQVLLQAKADLEQRVRERTEDLHRTNEDLQEVVRELEQFRRIASHDLKTRLGSLISYPQMLSRKYGNQLNEEARKWLDRIIVNAELMKQLLDSLTEYTKVLERNRPVISVDCNAAVAGACMGLSAEIQLHNVIVKAQPLPTLLGKKDDVMILFQNLIGNAIKYRAPDRPLTIDIGVERQDNAWCFHVRDNGMGIEKKYCETIFVLGIKSRVHKKSEIPGSGFGLTICETIVHGHGGRIWVESEFGSGSTFYFTLPLQQAGASPERPASGGGKANEG